MKNKGILVLFFIALVVLILSYLFFQHFLVIIAIGLLVVFLFIQHRNTLPD